MRQLKRHPKLPKELPTYILKATWDATAILIKLQAKSPLEAIDRGWMKVAKMEGGMNCLGVKVIETRT